MCLPESTATFRILFVASFLLVTAQYASAAPSDGSSVAPSDGSSATVDVTQGDHEYLYKIRGSRETEPHQPNEESAKEADEIPQQILVNTLQPKTGQLSEEENQQKIQDQIQPEIQGRDLKGMENHQGQLMMNVGPYRQIKGMEWSIENQPQTELQISLPGQRSFKSLDLQAVETKHQEDLKVIVPGYRLIPSHNVEYIDQPFYYPFYIYRNYPYEYVRYV